MSNDVRLEALSAWIAQVSPVAVTAIAPASADASFRRYFRAFHDGKTFVVMDAPPDKEDVRPYLRVTQLLEAIGVHVPHVHEIDVASGLLLLNARSGPC